MAVTMAQQDKPVSVGRDLSILDLEFERTAVLCHGSAGTPYTKWVWSGMPKIPFEFLDAVAYLYESEEQARSGSKYGGSGFFISYPSTHKPHRHYYFATNYHVIDTKDALTWLRVNLHPVGSGVEVFKFDIADWQTDPGMGDLAIMELDMPVGGFRFHSFRAEQLVQRDNWGSILGVGEDVFMIGRFIDNDGGHTNHPAARFGHVSIGPAPMRDLPNSHKSPDHFCLDMNSRSGFSGSPVITYRTHGTDLSLHNSAWPFPWHPPLLSVIGIHCSQFPEILTTADGTEIAGKSGMTVALASWHILDLLQCDRFAKRRSELDAKWKMKNLPRPE